MDISQDYINEAKLWIRRSGADLDTEVRQTIAACVLDMKNAGVVRASLEDALISQAVKFYLKGHFGYDEQFEKWIAAYEHLKAALALSSDYNQEVEN